MPRSRSLAELIQENRSVSGGPPVNSEIVRAAATQAMSQGNASSGGALSATGATHDSESPEDVTKKLEGISSLFSFFGG